MPISRDTAGTLNQLGHITGIVGVSSEHTLEIIPSVTLDETGRRIPSAPVVLPPDGHLAPGPGRLLNAPVNSDLGLTMRYSITPTVILDFTLNPDFAQIEADRPVVTANQRFPIFFDEKRPFFLEGIEVFQTPLNAVHTRTIIDPDVAAKLSGKSGRNAFGVLLASDNAPGHFTDEEQSNPALLPGIQKFIDKNSYVAVVRFTHDVGKDSSIGFINTDYSFIENHNYVGGFDGRIRIDAQTVFSFQVLGTHSQRFFYEPDLNNNIYRTGNALGYYFSYSKTGRHFDYGVDGQGFTPDYLANLGFTRRVNTNVETGTVQYKSEPNPKGTLISWTAKNKSSIRFDFQGRSQVWDQSPTVSFNFIHQFYVSLYGFFGYERLFEEDFGPKRTATRPGAFIGDDSERRAMYRGLGFSTGANPSKKYSFNFDTYYATGFFDFDFGALPLFPRVSPAALSDPFARLDPGPGNQFFANVSITYQPTDSLRTAFTYTKTRLRRSDTNLVAFDSNIYSAQSTYQFTRFIFARARVDYESLDSNVRCQYLVGWTPSPGTSFYAGYNDDLNYNGFNPFTNEREPGFQRNARGFFVKVSYLFRYGL